MKRINKYLAFLALPLMFMACEQTEFETTEKNLGKYVSFSSPTISFQESSATTTADGESVIAGNTTVFSVFRSTSDLSADLTVNISIKSVFATTTDFANAGDDASTTVGFSTEFSNDVKSVLIPAGKASANITVTAFNDDFSAGDKTVTLTITGTSDPSFNIGQQNIGGSVILTVVDDDCPIDLGAFAGEYEMTIAGGENSCCPDFDLCASAARDCSGVVTLAADASDPLGQTAILTHPSFGGEYKIQFITCPKQVTVTQQMESIFGVGVWNMQQGSMLGSYSDESKDISIVGLLGGNGDFIINLKKKN